MFERFTKDARHAIVFAQEEARMLNHDEIGVEHILIGVLATEEAGLAELLATVGLSVDEARSVVAKRHKDDVLGVADAEALRSIGIDLDAVRESLDATFGQDALDRAREDDRRDWFGRPRNFGHIPFTGDAKKAVELSLREALARKDDHIGTEHVLLGILRAPGDVARAVIESHVTTDDLRGRLVELLDRAA